MERQITVTRNELIKAFERWQEDCARDEDGSFTDPCGTPEEGVDALLTYVDLVQGQPA